MNPENLNADTISGILSSLSEEDISGLMGMAQSLFSREGPTAPKEENKKTKEASFGDFASIAKIASLMNLLSGEENDPRCNLLSALRPMLSKEKQPKVDQAIKMLQLMALLPKLKELN